MVKANVGHSALDVTAGIVEALANQPDSETRLKFLQAAVTHAEGQAEQAERQYERIAEKLQALTEMWRGKLDEAARIRDTAHETVDVYTRELDALGG